MYVVNSPEGFTRDQIFSIINLLDRKYITLQGNIYFCSSYREYLKYKKYLNISISGTEMIFNNKMRGVFTNRTIFVFAHTIKKEIESLYPNQESPSGINYRYEYQVIRTLYHEICHARQYNDEGDLIYNTDGGEDKYEQESDSFSKQQIRLHFNDISDIMNGEDKYKLRIVK